MVGIELLPVILRKIALRGSGSAHSSRAAFSVKALKASCEAPAMYRVAWASAILVAACGSNGTAPAPIVVPTEPVAPAPVAQETAGVVATAPAPPATTEPDEPPPPETPPPAADFTSLADVIKAGAKAKGKM